MKIYTLTLAGGSAEVSLHPMVWDGLKEIACREGTAPSEFVQQLIDDRRPVNLAAAIVTEIVAYFRVLVVRLEAEQRRHDQGI